MHLGLSNCKTHSLCIWCIYYFICPSTANLLYKTSISPVSSRSAFKTSKLHRLHIRSCKICCEIGQYTKWRSVLYSMQPLFLLLPSFATQCLHVSFLSKGMSCTPMTSTYKTTWEQLVTRMGHEGTSWGRLPRTWTPNYLSAEWGSFVNQLPITT
jgi:hypothetical protein